jgi:hypothetical protein
MFEGMNAIQIIAMLSPLIALQFGLAVFCLAKIVRQGTANLNKVLWGFIVTFVNIFGPVAFLLFGRRKDR